MTARDEHPVTLPGGLWRDGGLRREAAVRPLAGADEAELADDERMPAERVSAVLARCVTRLAGRRPGRDDVRALAAGDREALMLHVHRATFGERLPVMLDCPADGCGGRMDVDLDVGQLLLEPGGERSSWHAISLTGADGSARQVRFRLPTGADQQAAAALAAGEGPDSAGTALLRRCLEGWDEELPKAAAEELSAHMALLDPQAEIWLAAECPHCGAEFSALLDAGAYLLAELTRGAARLYREVHRLAFHYHWSEAEIMAMPPRKRRRYLDLLDDELGAP